MSIDNIRLDGRVAAVTGAGNGLGRAYALELASRGAHVVVNDLGGNMDGQGSDATIADSVVAEILAAGGEAVAHHGDVAQRDHMEDMVDQARRNWGRIDILVSNAGIGGGGLFISPEEWDRVLGVNLHGLINPLTAAWPHFEAQNYGRVVNTVSSSFFGTPGSGAYATSKGGGIGLTKVLASTYPDTNIKVNALMPIAWTRMNERAPNPVYKSWLQEHFQPEKVAAFIPVLCSEGLEVSGEVFTVGGGRAARVLFETTTGWFEKEPTAESFAANFDSVMAGDGAAFARSGQGDLARYAELLGDRGPF